MKCPKCQVDNSDTARFCSGCGASLSQKDGAFPSFTRTLETPPQPLVRGAVFAERYEIIEELGHGGMGSVFRVEDKKTGEEIALKLIKSEIAGDRKTIDRFRNELITARKIRHKNICGMYDLGEYQDNYYITMEYVSGEDLKDFLHRSKRLAIPTAVALALQICEGLSEAHSLGVVHRDLKPSNIMIDKDGNARIMDFGIARSLETKGETGEGVVIGTPEYMSPEQAEAREVDPCSDIYSLGVILYEMVTGQLPFTGDTPLSLALKHKSKAPSDPRELNAQIPEDLSQVILQCLEKDCADRYKSAADVRSELEAIEKGMPTTAKDLSEKKRTASKEITVTFGVGKLWKPAVIVALLIATVIAIRFLFFRSGTSPPASIEPSVAVLPFTDLSPEQDQGYFCEGFSESLISALTKISDLRIPARTSSFSFKEKEIGYAEMGETLNVDTVLEGSVQKAEDTLRIIAKLIKVSDGSILWSETYNRKLVDVFRIQDEITLNIVDNLEITLGGGDRANLTKRSTDNIEAYNLYLQGKYFRWREILPNFIKAKRFYEEAIAEDPNFASAYSGLADIYMLLGMWSVMSRDEAASLAKENAQRALELDPGSAIAHSSIGVIIEVFDWDWDEAEKNFLRAIELNPNCFEARYEYGFMLIRMRRWDEAETQLKEAVRIDPLSVMGYDRLGMVYRLKGDEEKSQEHYKIASELDNTTPTDESPLEYATRLIERDGRLPPNLARLANAYIQSGEEEKADKILNELRRLYETRDFGNIALFISRIYYLLDEIEQSFDWLDKAYEKRDPLLISINTNSTLLQYQSHPRIKAIREKMGLN